MMGLPEICASCVLQPHTVTHMPDDVPLSTHVTMRVPTDIVDAYDRLAKILERPRIWVMLRALRAYMDAEGFEIIEDSEVLAELDAGGDSVSAEDVIAEMRDMVEAGERRRAKGR